MENEHDEILDYFLNITSISELSPLLKYIVNETPKIIKASRCSIYLVPEYVPNYQGLLIDEDYEEYKPSRRYENIIVLAQTNFPEKQHLIGKAFYPSGEDLTGWVFRHKQHVMFKNSRDANEIQLVDRELKPSTRYIANELDDNKNEPRPVLYLPLIVENKAVGVLKFHKPNPGTVFSTDSLRIGRIISQIVTSLISKNIEISELGNTVFSLAKISSDDDINSAGLSITRELNKLLDFDYCELYVRNEELDCLELLYSNGKLVRNYDNPSRFYRNQGLVGWVFNTGQFLCIDDLHNLFRPDYLEIEKKLTDDLTTLRENPLPELFHKEKIKSIDHPIAFIAAPVIQADGSTSGVICVHNMSNKNAGKSFLEIRFELSIVLTFASALSFANSNSQTKLKRDLLLELGEEIQTQSAIDLVCSKLPKIIPNSNCFIFENVRSNRKRVLQLRKSNIRDLILEYKNGQGKTGFCASIKKPINISHYGTSLAKQTALIMREEEIKKNSPRISVFSLFDEKNRKVGLVEFWNTDQGEKDTKKKLLDFTNHLTIDSTNGLATIQSKKRAIMGISPSFSYFGVPLIIEPGETWGVISVTRCFPNAPFSSDDVRFLTTIAHIITSIIQIENNNKEKIGLLVFLGHEISSSLKEIIGNLGEIKEKDLNSRIITESKDNILRMVNYLEMTSQNMLSMVSGSIPVRNFTPVNISIPLLKASTLLKKDAEKRGLTIKDPFTIDSIDYPQLEISEKDIVVVFRNILHNAIKNSPESPIFGVKPEISILCSASKLHSNMYQIDIVNFGTGIPSEEFDLIFLPLKRGSNALSSNQDGIGMGLFYSKKIIELMHDGVLSVESKPYKGKVFKTVFSIELPTLHEQHSSLDD